MEDSIRSAGEKLLDRLVAKALENEGTTPTVLIKEVSRGDEEYDFVADDGVPRGYGQRIPRNDYDIQGDVDGAEYELQFSALRENPIRVVMSMGLVYLCGRGRTARAGGMASKAYRTTWGGTWAMAGPTKASE